jgi:ArsR family transcriptional regulator, virulence genes transcriptional regulator
MIKVITTPTTELEFESKNTRKAALVVRAINHKLRQQMLKLIHESENITVTELYQKLDLEQSVASQHLAILRHSGIVYAKRDGKFIHYSVNYQRIKEVTAFASRLIGF